MTIYNYTTKHNLLTDDQMEVIRKELIDVRYVANYYSDPNMWGLQIL